MQGGETNIDVEIDQNNIQVGALEVLKVLRPSWKAEDVKFLPLTEGITNYLVGCYLKSDAKKSDAIVMRVFGQGSDVVVDRTSERQNMQILHAAGCSAPFYAQFNNGIAYAFVAGRSLDVEDVNDPHISKLIAAEMAKMHCIDTDKIGGYKLDKTPFVWRKAKEWLDRSPEGFDDPEKHGMYLKNIPNKQKLAAELAFLEKELSSLPAEVGFAHNDLLVKNIIYNEEKDKVTFIDYEYGAYNYVAFDIGGHFNEFAGVETVDYSLLPSEEFKSGWVRHYLETKFQLQGKSKDSVTDKDVERTRILANKFSLVSHFFWTMWALIQTKNSLIDFDYLGYAKIRIDEYFAKRDQFLALRLPE